MLDPGAKVLLVRDRGAFLRRYGPAMGALIAGEYQGNLSNDGEHLTLLDASGMEVRSFAYNDRAPWPEEADGDGLSLVLIAPGQSPPPDHADPINWRASFSPGGDPGAREATTFADWKAANGIDLMDPDADPDGDGRGLLLEYAFATLPEVADASAGLSVAVQNLDVDEIGDRYLIFVFAKNLLADDLVMEVEHSGDLLNWGGGAVETVFVGRARSPDKPLVETMVFRSARPVEPGAERFYRLRVSLR